MAAFAHVVVPHQRRERHFRNKDGLSLDFSDAELRERYRFGRESIQYISGLVAEDIERKTRRNMALTVVQQVLVTLRFLASGSFLQVIGDTLGLDKSTMSRVVTGVVDSLNRRVDTFIKWPTNVNQTKQDFYTISGFPNVIGAIDGTHIRIQAPHEDEASYVNRKGFHSINVQAVCDAQGKFTNMYANWPGSCHDSHIFRTSKVCAYMERNDGWENGVLLGDSGYPCRPFLMAPYLNPTEDNKMRYNRCHSSTRTVIERTFGRWKRRFHVLHSEIRMKPKKVCKIVIACAILHNIALQRNEPEINEQQLEIVVVNGEGNNGLQDGRGIRDHIARTYFTRH